MLFPALYNPPRPKLRLESGSGVCSSLLGPSDFTDSFSESLLESGLWKALYSSV